MSETKSTFETLEVWIKSRKTRNKISKLSKCFSPEEKYKTVDQMIRASRSVTANIAQGYGRYNYQENIEYCRQARGSLYEFIDHIYVALDENYIDNKIQRNIKLEILEVLGLLNGYLKYLSERKKNSEVVLVNI